MSEAELMAWLVEVVEKLYANWQEILSSLDALIAGAVAFGVTFYYALSRKDAEEAEHSRES